MKTVIVTGLIGSGKSAVCALLRERGIPVYNSDVRTKRLYDRRPSLVHRLEKCFRTRLRDRDGRLDRRRLSAIIFADDRAREQLEAIVFPQVLEDFKRWRRRQKGCPFVVLESAVILSKPIFRGLAQAVVIVEAPEEVRLQRVMARENAPEAAVRARMAAQHIPSAPEYIRVVNDGSREALASAVELVFFDNNSYLCKNLISNHHL